MIFCNGFNTGITTCFSSGGGAEEKALSPGSPPQGVAAITVFPNPVVDRLWINGPKLADHDYSVQLFSASGSLVKTFAINGTNAIDVSRLPAGLYLVAVLEDGERVALERVVKL
jgi:hypothetical protein